MDILQFRLFVIRPALQRIDLWSKSAENLVLGTGLIESKLEYVDQTSNGVVPGPAYGLFQMEKPTHDDIWENYLKFQPKLGLAVLNLAGWDQLNHPPVEELWGNNFYSAAMCRVHYRRISQPLPAEDDALGMARYWKSHYNTYSGKGSVQDAYLKFIKVCNDDA